MNELVRAATVELAGFLAAHLPKLSPDWWKRHVIDRLGFQQQRIVQERNYSTLQQLDLAALLRVLDQNWFELSNGIGLPREGRGWVKELQTVRNKWAHLSSEALSPSEMYRDADTLARLLVMIGAQKASIDVAEGAKTGAINELARTNQTVSNAPSGPPSGSVDAPLTTASSNLESSSLFKVGDLVALRSNPDAVMPVMEVMLGGTEKRYRVFQNNTKTTYYESQLQLAAIPHDDHTRVSVNALRGHLTSLHILSPSTANLYSLRSGRIQFVPYQYRPVLKLIRADRPRLLIADEVGVGKTIEAGLIIKELRARSDISSVLIICPKALVSERKWFVEMKRFDEHFTSLDGKILRHCLLETHLEGEWPDQYAKAILPFSLFDSELLFGRNNARGRQGEGLLALDPAPKFDLVIVDEAHHIRNSETFLHQGVRYFCDNADAVLLLTATPVQLGSEDLYTLLNVLRPDLVIDHASFEQMAEPNPFINEAVQHCRAAREGWSKDARKCLDQVAETEWGRLFVRESPAFQEIYDRLQDEFIEDRERVALTNRIEGLYTFNPMFNRTRRRDIGEFTTRKPETITIEFTESQRQLHDRLLDVVAKILGFFHGETNVKFMMTTIRRQAASCLYGLAPMLEEMLTGKLDQLEPMEASGSDDKTDLSFVDRIRGDVQSVIDLANRLDREDPKVKAFVRVLLDKNKLGRNKSMVFSTFRHTLRYLARHVEDAGLRYGLVHGGVDDEDRAVLRRRFALPRENPEALDVLLSSEVGCEGLDFQFCDLLLNYDLPWNPMRVEQRIGRIDRYGQESEAVAIVNLITPGTVDAEIYDRCLWRIGVFHHSVGGSEEILGQITKEIHDIAESFALTPEERTRQLQQLSDNSIRKIREEQELEAQQAALFGLALPKQGWQKEVEAAESFWLSPPAIQGCISAYLALRLGTDAEYILGDKPLRTLRLNQDARNRLLEDFRRLPRSNEPVARSWERWLKGTQPTLAVTFDQPTAAETAQIVHLSIGHPLVRQAASAMRIEEPASVALVASSDSMPPGDYQFGLYKWSKRGVRPDESLVAVASNPVIEDELLKILETACDAEKNFSPAEIDHNAIDARHHGKWTTAQANHISENREQVEHRIQSLTASHRARCNTLQAQIENAINPKIKLMRESELTRANADFARRMEDLQRSADSGDIHAAPVVFGVLTIREI